MSLNHYTINHYTINHYVAGSSLPQYADLMDEDLRITIGEAKMTLFDRQQMIDEVLRHNLDGRYNEMLLFISTCPEDTLFDLAN